MKWLLLFILPLGAAQAANCDFKSVFSFLNEEKPVELIAGDPKSRVTFSYDGEFRDAELMKWLRQDPEVVKELREFFAKENFSKEKIMKALGISPKQFDTFVMRSKIPIPPDTMINLMDLPPAYYEAVVASPQKLLPKKILPPARIEKLARIVEKKLLENGISARGFQDCNALEVCHLNFESVPKNIRTQLKFYHELFPKSTFHAHLGLPSGVVSKEELVTISRALESRMILKMATAENFVPISSMMNHSSSLVADVSKNSAHRGFVKFQYDAFGEPGSYAHDLEIRQSENFRDLEESMNLGTELAVNRKKLLHSNEGLRTFDPDFDPYTNNLPGALTYLGKLMQKQKAADLRLIGTQMDAFAQEIFTAGKIEPSMRKKIRQFLLKNKVESKINASLFLK